jgi:hypothetical protein
MAASWKTKTIVCQGGIRQDIEPVMIDAVSPGALLDSKNTEASFSGGYSQIKGFSLYSSTEVPGTNSVLGTFVFNDTVIACRASNIVYGTGGSWTNISTTRSGAGRVRATKYRWSEPRITLVDGTNYPLRWNGSGATNLSNAPLGASSVKQFKNYLCFGKGGVLTISAPNDDTVYSAGSGGATFNIGDSIQNFAIWRDSLYILCTTSIYRLDGDSASNWTINPVSLNVGCSYPDTVIELAGDVYYLSSDGVRTISGTERTGDVNLEVISNPIKEYLEEVLEDYSASGSITAIPVTTKSQYRLFFSSSGVSATNSPGINMCFTKHEGSGIIEFHKLLGIQVASGDSGRISTSNTELVVHGCQNGYVFQQESGYTFNGANIPALLQFPYYVFDDPAVRKTIYSMRTYVDTLNDSLAHLTLQVNLDDNDAGIIQPPSIDLTAAIPQSSFLYGYGSYGLAVYGAGLSKNYRTNPIGSGYNIGWTLSSEGSNPPWNVKTMIAEYEMSERQ